MMEFVTGKDDIPYTMENRSHVWNHQPGCYKFVYTSRYITIAQIALGKSQIFFDDVPIKTFKYHGF